MNPEHTYSTTVDTAAVVSDAPPAPRLLLAPSRGVQLTGALGWLARLYKLDVHATSLLTRRAATEMGYVALMLTVITLFDLAAWGLLWNMILNGGRLEFSRWTPVALTCASFFSAMVFIYERQFMTADTYGRWGAVLKSMALRIVVLFIAAAITTQPIEVLVFKGPIMRRIHEESVRLEAVTKLQDLKEREAAARGQQQALVGAAERSAFDRAVETQTNTRERLLDLVEQNKIDETQRNRASAEVRRLTDALNAARAAGKSTRRLGASLDRARRRLETAETALTGSSQRIDILNGQMSSMSTEVTNAQEALAGVQRQAVADVEHLRRWIGRIRQAKPGAVVPDERGVYPVFADQEYDFFQQLGVINDIYNGLPPNWPSVSQADKDRLGVDFQLRDPDPNDPYVQRRVEEDKKTFFYSYWAVVCIAAVIPLLVLALKGLLPHDLKIYYSRREQIAAGDYETLRFDFDRASRQWFADDDPNDG